MTLPQHFSQQDALCISFGTGTQLMVFAADGKTVSQIFMAGKSKKTSELWFSLEGAIRALNPQMTEAKQKAIMRKLGKNKVNMLPDHDEEFDDGKILYTYNRSGDKWVVQMWPSHKAK
jgi:hypothetical protein